MNNILRSTSIAFAALIFAALSAVATPVAHAADLSGDYGYGDYYPSSSDYGYGDYYTSSSDYGYGDYYTSSSDYGYGDYYTSSSDYGYGDYYPSSTDYGYGDYYASTDYGYGDYYPSTSYSTPSYGSSSYSYYPSGSTGSYYASTPSHSYYPSSSTSCVGNSCNTTKTTVTNTCTGNSCNTTNVDNSVTTIDNSTNNSNNNNGNTVVTVSEPSHRSVSYSHPTCSAGYYGTYPNCYRNTVAYNTASPYVSLTAVPYTGLDLGPVGTALYWSFLVLFSLFGAYLIVVKRAHMGFYRWYKKALFGEDVPAPVEAAPAFAGFSQADLQNLASMLRSVVDGPKAIVAQKAEAPEQVDGVDPFIFSQIHRNK